MVYLITLVLNYIKWQKLIGYEFGAFPSSVYALISLQSHLPPSFYLSAAFCSHLTLLPPPTNKENRTAGVDF